MKSSRIEFPPISHVVEWPDIFVEGHAVRGQQGRAADVAVGA